MHYRSISISEAIRYTASLNRPEDNNLFFRDIAIDYPDIMDSYSKLCPIRTDITTMNEKARKGYYTSYMPKNSIKKDPCRISKGAIRLKNDILLMANNCIIFNGKDSVYGLVAANFLSSTMEEFDKRFLISDSNDMNQKNNGMQTSIPNSSKSISNLAIARKNTVKEEDTVQDKMPDISIASDSPTLNTENTVELPFCESTVEFVNYPALTLDLQVLIPYIPIKIKHYLCYECNNKNSLVLHIVNDYCKIFSEYNKSLNTNNKDKKLIVTELSSLTIISLLDQFIESIKISKKNEGIDLQLSSDLTAVYTQLQKDVHASTVSYYEEFIYQLKLKFNILFESILLYSTERIILNEVLLNSMTALLTNNRNTLKNTEPIEWTSIVHPLYLVRLLIHYPQIITKSAYTSCLQNYKSQVSNMNTELKSAVFDEKQMSKEYTEHANALAKSIGVEIQRLCTELLLFISNTIDFPISMRY